MPLYQITGPDGTVYEIEGPEGASRAQVIAAVQRRQGQQKEQALRDQLAALQNTPAAPPKRTLGGYATEYGKALGSGAVNLAETAGVGIAALLPDEAEKAARAKLEEIAGIAKAPLKAAPGYEDIAGRGVVEGIGSSLPFFAMGPLGWAGRIGAGALGVAAGAGEARENAEAKGATADERRTATLIGAPVGLFDLIAPEAKMVKSVLSRELGPITSMVATAGKRGGIEGATEAAQKIVQNMIAKGVYDPSQPLLAGSGEEGMVGAGAGALTSLILDLAIPGRRRGYAPPPKPTPEPTPTATPAAPAVPGIPVQDIAPAARAQGGAQSRLGQLAEEEGLYDRDADSLTADSVKAPPGAMRPPLRRGPVTEEEKRDIASEDQDQSDLIAAEAERARLREEAIAKDELRQGEIAQQRARDRETSDPNAGQSPFMRQLREDSGAAQLEDTFAQGQEHEAPPLFPELPTLYGPKEERPQESAEPTAAPVKDIRQRTIDEAIRDTKQQEKSAARTAREEMLLDALASDEQDLAKAFQNRLRQAGVTDLTLRPHEQELISDAYDQRYAEDNPQSKSDSGVADLESQVKEARGQKFFREVGAPQQKPQAFSEGEQELQAEQDAKYGTVLTPEVLDATGLPRQSGFYKQLVGKDMAAPAQQPALGQILARVRANPALSQRTKDAIERIATRAMTGVAKQSSLFGPRGGVTKAAQATGRKEAKDGQADGTRANAGTDAQATGTRDESAGRREQANAGVRADSDAQVAKEPDVAGLGDRGRVQADTGSREAAKPSALKEEKPKAEEKPKVEEKAEGKKPTKTREEHTAEMQRQGALKLAGRQWSQYADTKTQGKWSDLSAEQQEKWRKVVDSGKPSIADTLDIAPEKSTKSLNLSADDVRLIEPVSADVADYLERGDLKGALGVLAGLGKGRVAKIATKLVGVLGDTKVEIVPNLESDGRPVAGLFDPKTNTIKLDKKSLSTHSLLHEVVHAATSHTLANPSHPMTKQLTQLFESVRGSLDTMYGAMSLDEFVAEAFSNPEFQAKLASITPEGRPVTALQRFLSSVGNFLRKMLGMDTKPAGSALDSADEMINRILSPAPDTRAGDQLMLASVLGKGKQVLDAMGERIVNAPEMNQEWRDRMHYFFTGRAPGALKDTVRISLPLNALCDVAKKYLSNAPRLDRLVQERSGAEDTRNRAVEQTVLYAERWKAKATTKQLKAFFDTVAESTLSEVDPTRPLEHYSKYWATVTTTDPNNPSKEKMQRVAFDTAAERAAYIKRTNESRPGAKAKPSSNPDREKIDTWKKLQQGLKDMGPEGVEVYKVMRDSYAKMHDEVVRLLGARIDAMVQDKEVAKNVKKQLFEKLVNSGRIDPYFPLTRKGDFWLSYNVGGEHYVEAFEYPAARERAIEQLKQMQKAGEKITDIEAYHKRKGYDFRKAPSASFVHNVLRTLETNKVNPEVTGRVMDAFLDMLPETSFAQSFRKREGKMGFERDAFKAFRSKAYSLSRQITNMEYGAKLERLRMDLIDEAKVKGDTETNKYADELEQRINLALNPGVAPWSKIATTLGFNMTLGLNVSSALINMSQIPLVSVPYLGGKYGYPETTRAMGRAGRLIKRGGFSREVEALVPLGKDGKKVKIKAMPSIDNIDFGKKENADIAHVEALVKLARERGQLNRSQIYDTLDMSGDHTLMTKVNAVTGYTFHLAERMNRETSLVMAYELELQRLVGKEGALKDATAAQQQQAAEYAIEVTELTNGGTAAAAAPRIAQSSLGKVLFMYKRYGVSMYYMMFKTAREMLKDADPEVRRTAKRQLAGIYASSALMAGVQGIPMFGVAAMLYNMFLKDDDEDDFDTAARKWMGELFYSGLGNGVLGVELASRMGLSDLLFRDTAIKPSDSVMAALAEQMGGPVFGVASRIERGLKLISEGHTERGLEQMMPSAIGNAMKSVRFYTEGAQTLRGDPIVGEIGMGNAFAQFFGFAPAEYTRQLAINSSLKNIERAALEKKQDLLRKYYVASRMGDGAEMSDLMNQMMDYSVKHPTDFITPETIERSMAQHMRTSSEMYAGITLNKKLRDELMANAAEFDDD